jgi:hypothetical protein
MPAVQASSTPTAVAAARRRADVASTDDSAQQSPSRLRAAAAIALPVDSRGGCAEPWLGSHAIHGVGPLAAERCRAPKRGRVNLEVDCCARMQLRGRLLSRGAPSRTRDTRGGAEDGLHGAVPRGRVGSTGASRGVRRASRLPSRTSRRCPAPHRSIALRHAPPRRRRTASAASPHSRPQPGDGPDAQPQPLPAASPVSAVRSFGVQRIASCWSPST